MIKFQRKQLNQLCILANEIHPHCMQVEQKFIEHFTEQFAKIDTPLEVMEGMELVIRTIIDRNDPSGKRKSGTLPTDDAVDSKFQTEAEIDLQYKNKLNEKDKQ